MVSSFETGSRRGHFGASEGGSILLTTPFSSAPCCRLLGSVPPVVASAVCRLLLDVFRDLVQKTFPLLKPPSQRFKESFVPLLAFRLRRRLEIGAAAAVCTKAAWLNLELAAL
jgi:hypothetical protein